MPMEKENELGVPPQEKEGDTIWVFTLDGKPDPKIDKFLEGFRPKPHVNYVSAYDPLPEIPENEMIFGIEPKLYSPEQAKKFKDRKRQCFAYDAKTGNLITTVTEDFVSKK
jgi:hypothetical protein